MKKKTKGVNEKSKKDTEYPIGNKRKQSFISSCSLLVLCQTRSTLSMMSSSESPEDHHPVEEQGLHPAEDPPYFRKRKTSKIILDALGVSCQVAPSTAGEVSLLDPPAAEVDPAAAADARGIPCHSTA